MIRRWQVDGNLIRNPDGRHVATIPANLPSVIRRELVEHLLDAPDEAYRRGVEEGQESGDAPLEYEELE